MTRHTPSIVPRSYLGVSSGDDSYIGHVWIAGPSIATIDHLGGVPHHVRTNHLPWESRGVDEITSPAPAHPPVFLTKYDRKGRWVFSVRIG